MRAAEILGLTPYLDRYPRQLSGGQRQRVAMGRAIVRDPQVFLFDEPLSNLDAKLRVQMRTEIKELHQRLKTTNVYVTHDQIEAMTMADKIVVMHDGIVEQIGGPLELYDKPNNLFVAGFIGSPAMNFIGGTLKRSNGLVFVETPKGVKLPTYSHAAGTDGQPVIYGVRPEHFQVASSGAIPIKVHVVEPTAPIHSFTAILQVDRSVLCLMSVMSSAAAKSFNLVRALQLRTCSILKAEKAYAKQLRVPRSRRA